MLTDEERRTAIDVLEWKDFVVWKSKAQPVAAAAIRLDAELKAAEAYGQLEHNKLHQEHRARMKAEAEVERLQLAVIQEREKIWAEREQHEAAIREVQK